MAKRRTWPDSLIEDLEKDRDFFRFTNKDDPGFMAALGAAVVRAAEKDPRGGEMLLKYYRDELTLREIGLQYGVTPERVRTILVRQRRILRRPATWSQLPRHVYWALPWYQEEYEKGDTT